MTVKKSTADDVRKKFEALKKDKDEPAPVDTVLDGGCLLHFAVVERWLGTCGNCALHAQSIRKGNLETLMGTTYYSCWCALVGYVLIAPLWAAPDMSGLLVQLSMQ